MQEGLEFVAMTTVPRWDQSIRVTKSIKCHVLSEAETVTILATKGRVLGHYTPTSTWEFLTCFKTISTALAAGATQVAEQTHDSWLLLWEHFEDQHIYQFKLKRLGKRLFEKVLVCNPDGQIQTFEFPMRRPEYKPYRSTLLGWDKQRLFGSYSNLLYDNYFWVFDFSELQPAKPGNTPLTISPDLNLNVCYSPDLSAFELHFHKPTLSSIYLVNDGILLMGIVGYDQRARNFTGPSVLALPEKQFGPASMRYTELGLGLKIHLSNDFTQMLTAYWNIGYQESILSLCLSATQLDFINGSSKLLNQLFCTPELTWKYRQAQDSCEMGIFPFAGFSLLLVTFNQNVFQSFTKTPIFSMTYVHVFRSGLLSLMGVSRNKRDSLPIRGSRLLHFADRLQLDQYYLAELPNTVWPRKRFVLFRLAFKLA